ncbi:hypothetical protein NHQ30_001793 [Ciborinia camelliae]|nr:hypothetical protein NHQ30_001793 [Ciborinia camelliae]
MKILSKVIRHLVASITDSDHTAPHKHTSKIKNLSPNSHKRKDLINSLMERTLSPSFLQQSIKSTFSDLEHTIHNTIGRNTTRLTTEEHHMHTYARFFDDLFFAHKLKGLCGLLQKTTGTRTGGTFGEVIQWREQPNIVFYADPAKKASLTNEKDKKEFLERLLVGMSLAFLNIYECKGRCCSEVPEDSLELERKLFSRLSSVAAEYLGIQLELEWKDEGFVKVGKSAVSPAHYGATRFY